MLTHSDERQSDVASVHRRYNVLIRRTAIRIIIVGNEITHAKDKENIVLHWALVEKRYIHNTNMWNILCYKM